MTDYGHDLLFGCFLTPEARHADTVVQLAQFADDLGLDLLGVQDHPYQPRFLDMWTLLSHVAGVTNRIRLVPDVANLPLRPPAVLASAATSLDILSGGRVELGLGSGAFSSAIESIGGPHREPAEAVNALAEAITVIRSLWTPGRPVTFAGKHYSLRNAQPGPLPEHPIGIWLGAYKQRMLRLTGRLADGWIPTLQYAAPSELGPMTATIDEAAMGAGRTPAAIRRVYNIAGRFSAAERGFLDGPAEVWAQQLTELVFEYGFSAFLLAPGGNAASDLERFARQVAPAVREEVERIRGGGPMREAEALPTEPPVEIARPSVPAPRSHLLHDAERPHVNTPPAGRATATGQTSAQTLIQVHDHLRAELAQLLEAATAVAAGHLDPASARSLINRMTIRQNYWTLGSFCAQYCRIVTTHHTIEDRYMFPALRREDMRLSAVLDRLHEEHEIIAAVVERLDGALVAMMTDPAGVEEVRRVASELGDALLSHLAYEEDELLGPLAHSSIAV